MAISEGRALVAGSVVQISKKKGMFKSNEVTESTGLARQVVHHHLKYLARDGHIEHYGNGIYGNVDVDRLIESFTNQTSTRSSRPQATKLVPADAAAFLNAAIDLYHLSLGEVDPAKSAEFRRKLLDVIDETTKSLKQVRKYLADVKPVQPKRRWRMLTFGRKQLNPEYDSWDYRVWCAELYHDVLALFEDEETFKTFYVEAEEKAKARGKKILADGDDNWQKGE